MIYVINGTLRYDTTVPAITANDGLDDIVLPLTPITSRLLQTLIQHQGHLISRETLLQTVWQDSPHDGSAHTLTQYLSNLRKIFREYLPDIEVIVTEPRLGYRFAAEVVVEVVEHDKPQRLPREAEDKTPAVPVIAARRNKIKERTLLYGGLLLALAALVIIAGYRISAVRQSDYPIQTSTLLTHYQGCPVYILHVLLSDARKNTYTDRFNTLVNEHRLTCTPDSAFYISMARGAEDGVPGNMMLSRCTENSGKPNACISYQYNRWQEAK